jgi:hypothetical protein
MTAILFRHELARTMVDPEIERQPARKAMGNG